MILKLLKCYLNDTDSKHMTKQVTHGTLSNRTKKMSPMIMVMNASKESFFPRGARSIFWSHYFLPN